MTNQPEKPENVRLQLNDLSPFLVVVLFRNEHPMQAEEQERLLQSWLYDELEWFQPENQRSL